MATRLPSESVIACNARLGMNLEGMWDNESNGGVGLDPIKAMEMTTSKAER